MENIILDIDGACDGHLHVFGAGDNYPLVAGAVYGVPAAPLEKYLEHVSLFGLSRYVLVQPSGYGTDNRYLLESLTRLGSSSARGVVEIDESDPSDVASLEEWHELGVRGLRVQTHSANPDEAAIGHFVDHLKRSAELAAARGWFLDVLTPIWLTRHILDALEELTVPFAIPHLGLHSGDVNEDRWVFDQILQMASRDDAFCWIKLTGFYRISKDPAYGDIEPLVTEAVTSARSRLLWGSDFPHLRHEDVADTHRQLATLLSWLPEQSVREAVFANNPAVLFDFPR